jgi:toxin YoeB
LLRAIQENPFQGIGKPEPLKHNLSGVWSRRINQEHRIIYEIIDENTIEILNIISLKGHYE